MNEPHDVCRKRSRNENLGDFINIEGFYEVLFSIWRWTEANDDSDAPTTATVCAWESEKIDYLDKMDFMLSTNDGGKNVRG